MRCFGGVYNPWASKLTTLRSALPSCIRFLILGRGTWRPSQVLRGSGTRSLQPGGGAREGARGPLCRGTAPRCGTRSGSFSWIRIRVANQWPASLSVKGPGASLRITDRSRTGRRPGLQCLTDHRLSVSTSRHVIDVNGPGDGPARGHDDHVARSIVDVLDSNNNNIPYIRIYSNSRKV